MAQFNHASGAANQNDTMLPSGFAGSKSEGRPDFDIQIYPVSWHTFCGIAGRKYMAAKATLLRMLQESVGHEQITNRRPTPRPIALYLMQLRAHSAQAQNHAARKQLTIATEWQASDCAPLPIKIKHISPDECDIPIVFG